MTYLQV